MIYPFLSNAESLLEISVDSLKDICPASSVIPFTDEFRMNLIYRGQHSKIISFIIMNCYFYDKKKKKNYQNGAKNI